MGKKSKRRGGTGGKKSSGSSLKNAGGQSAITSAGGRDGTLTDLTPENLVSRARALLQVPAPESLKGIVSTNDPSNCMLCSMDCLIDDTFAFQHCCGKILCRDCGVSRSCSALDILGQYRCIFCNVRDLDRHLIRNKEANAGKPWAQCIVGTSFVSKSPHESFGWFEKAAARGHPFAFIKLARLFASRDENFVLDLKLSAELAKKAYSMHSKTRVFANKTLCWVANEHMAMGDMENAGAALRGYEKETDPCAFNGKLDMTAAKIMLKTEANNLPIACKLLARAFSQGRIEAAEILFRAYNVRSEYALSNLWLYVTGKLREAFGDLKLNALLPDYTRAWDTIQDKRKAELREIRNSCGGCGAALEGDRRNMCRACRTYCYCSRECQKRHWNRSKDGHRVECLLVQEHCLMIFNTIRDGKIKV